MTQEQQSLAQTLQAVARLSSCQRRHVGCILVDSLGRVIVGANNDNIPFSTCERPTEQGNCGCLHAEVRAVCAYDWSVPVQSVWVSAAPCAPCAKVLTLVMPDTVYYLEDSWPMLEGFKVLDAAGIAHAKVI